MKCIKTSAQNHKEMRAALENQYVTWEDREQRRKALKKEKNKWLVLVAAGVDKCAFSDGRICYRKACSFSADSSLCVRHDELL